MEIRRIITYASGYDAKYIIWIVKDVRDEHSQEISWLNEHTDENINFFLIKIELWQIGNSAIAPKFQVVERPNERGKTVKSSTGKETEATKSQNFSYNLWSEFKEYALQHNAKYNLQSPQKQHWYSISVGLSAVHIELKTATRENSISCQFYIRDDHNLYNFLQQHKSEIETKIGEKLDWSYQEDRKASYIGIKKSFDFKNSKEYLQFYFECSKWNGEIENKEPDKCESLQWHDWNNIPENTCPYLKEAIDKVNQGISFYEDEF